MNEDYNMDALIAKYLAGEASPEDAMALDEWRMNHPLNEQYFRSAEKTFASVGNNYRIWQADTKVALVQTEAMLRQQRMRIMWWLVGISCALLILFGIWRSTESSIEKPVHPSEYAQNLDLEDGTKIEVGKLSQVQKKDGFGTTNRTVTLQGRATFEVEHNEEIPFIVETGPLTIEDIGTVFTVENQPGSDTIFVIVTEGIVRLYDEAGNELEVRAGEKAWYIKSLKTIVADATTKVFKFDFRDTKLQEAIDLISKAYDAEIILKPTSLGECRFTTRFYDEDLSTMLEIIAETMGLRYRVDNDKHILQGNHCQQ
ncbi:MAG: FecR domain-containing protein [Saprospiraceae bacterium]|nr:FecR domain-containing protein [Saprospiraceae bacterium]